VAKLVSVNVGMPKTVDWNGKSVQTAIWKSPVAGRVMARKLNLDGDGQADLQGHGGEQRAVLVYQMSSYRHWSEYLGRELKGYGQFGENLTVDGLEDTEVCVGDRFRIGEAVFEISQPRVTCFKVGLKLQRKELPAMLVAHGRPGFYMRVIQEGHICAGDEIVKVGDGPQRISVAEVDALLYKSEHPVDKLDRILRVKALSPGWRHSFNELLDAAKSGRPGGNAGLGIDIGRPPAWTGFRTLNVLDTVRESEDVTSFLLGSEDGSPLPASLPGQHVAVKIPTSAGPVTRMYSLSGQPNGATYRISVKREDLGQGSRALHAGVSKGGRLEVSAPRGAFILEDADTPVVLLSAGVGITPMLAMLHALSARSPEGARKVWWIHSARDGAHHPFQPEVATLVKLASARSHVTYTRPSPQEHPGSSFDAIGRVQMSQLSGLAVPKDADFYLCGPGQFLVDTQNALVQWGAAAHRIHVEWFGGQPSSSANSVQPHAPVGDVDQGVSVVFLKSGVTAHWADKFGSLLELAEACDVPVRWACRTGVCQNCRSSLVDGEVAYDPDPIEPPAAGTILLCCSTPRGDIQLDM
jgi:ferredoxin-NADP reductase/MOSC domain-containing protein YiiM